MKSKEEVQEIIDSRPKVVLIDFDKLHDFAEAINDDESGEAINRVWELASWYVKVEKIFIPEGGEN